MVCLRTWHFLSGPVIRLLQRKLSQPQGTAKLMATGSRVLLHSPSALLLSPVAALMTLSPYGKNCANSLTRFAVWLSLRLALRALKKTAPGSADLPKLDEMTHPTADLRPYSVNSAVEWVTVLEPVGPGL
ncbi:hypothetical protein PoB_001536400 [Plakobranchus ocellatus]|uniref:Uncharacterized protein n=1 Tax=Plakobranchus ocellatus TaxID=259542 RepID=A0AAV3Z0L2_9GAST|nr:hypothetical protein PoB_001536400 [Plakobranchus ocellatus]